jgi:hypothetical protein
MMRCTDCGKADVCGNGRCIDCEARHSTEGMGMMLLLMGVAIGLLIVGGLLYLSWRA